jgi:hypothetical protein
MSVLGELRAVAAKLSYQESRPACASCGKGRLLLIAEKPDPDFGILGVLRQTLKCDWCGKLAIV